MEDILKVNETITEEQDSQKKKKRFPILILIIMLLCLAVFGVLIGTGILPVPVGNGQVVDLDTAQLIKQASDVKDERTFRELLLLDMELDITVTGDIEINETLIVEGTKTLYGDATIKADIFGLFQERSVFEIQRDASMTIDGLVIDGNGMSDGYTVNQGAELTYLSGTIKKVRYGIRTNGLVTVEDVLITTTGRAAVQSLFKSEVTLNGGTYSNSNLYNIHVDSASSMIINEGVVVKEARGGNVYNNGTLQIYGGTFKDANQNAINNGGDLVMEYKGSKKNGYIEIANTGLSGVRMQTNTDCSIKNIHTTNIGTNAILIAAVGKMAAQGDVVIEDCLFEASGQVSGNAMSICGKVDMKNIQIKDSKDGAIYVKQDGDASIENVIVENCGGIAMTAEGATVTAQNISVNGTRSGIQVKVKDKSKGILNLSEITIAGSKTGNLYAYEGTELNVKDAVLEESVTSNINLRGAVVTLENVKALGTSEAKNCLYVAEGADVTLLGNTVISGGFSRGAGVVNATLTMKDGSICNNSGTEAGAGVTIIGGGTFNMLGGSITGNKTTASGGAVYVDFGTTFNMKGGTISGNESKTGGAAAVVQGTMNLSGGTIKNNTTETVGGAINVGRNSTKKTYGILNMTGGSIVNNKALTYGGGIHVSYTAIANLSGGQVTGNTADALGNGIYDNGIATLSGKFYMGNDVLALAAASTVLNIKGNSLSKHNADTPLLVAPAQNTTKGRVVVSCENENAAKALLQYVASGKRNYTLCQNDNDTKTMTVNYVAADMDMTGADKVYVTNFQELKAAVESTKSKRYIIIGADIEMESMITVPDATTVYIRDDGQIRTLSRADGKSAIYFRTYYGTGLYLVGTSYGNLVLDGTTLGDVEEKSIAALVQVRGTTEIRNVAFADNKSISAWGAAVSHLYGDTSIYSSTFTGGKAASAGAVYVDSGSMLVEDCIFENNTATASGGAIRTKSLATDVNLEIRTSTFNNNTAKGNGGAVNFCGGNLVVKDALFTNNKSTAGTGGGALTINEGSTATLIMSEYLTSLGFSGNSAASGGAIYTNKATVTIKGYTFDKNTSKSQAGALLVEKEASLELVNASFTNNETTASGGAIRSNGVLTINNSEFANNTAGTHGGAITAEVGTINVTNSAFVDNQTKNGNGGALCLTGKITANLSGGENVFESNTASANGGAIYTNNSTISVEDYTFNGNTAKAGGAVYVNDTGNVEKITGSTFNSNKATGTDVDLSGNCVDGGGAIFVVGKVSSIEGCTFDSNLGQDGGAIALSGGAVNNLKDSYFYSNKTVKSDAGKGGRGGAIYNRGANSGLTIESCVFGGSDLGNTSAADGGAIWANRQTTITGTGTFEGNSSSAGGGAVYVTGSSVVIVSGQAFTNNRASNGGAISSNNAGNNFTVTSSTFTSNGATGNGGVIYSIGTLVVEDATFQGNIAKSGAGVYVNGGTASFKGTDTTKAIFSGNRATGTETDGNGKTGNCKDGGGAIYVYAGTVSSMDGYTFSGNEGQDGGALVTNNGGVITKLSNSYFYSNKANVNSSNGGGRGGAIYNRGGNAGIIIENCVFGGTDADNNSLGNTAGTGGAIWANRITTVQGTGKFEKNSATGNGGAIYVTNPVAIIISGQTFTGNSATSQGGAMQVNNADNEVTITGSNFSLNTAKNGGAIYNNGKLTVSSSTFDTNSVNASSSGYGGAIYNNTGTANLNCDFISNHAYRGGAIYNNNGAVFKVTGGKFEGNKTIANSSGGTQDGGAIDNNSSKQDNLIQNATFIGNTSARHGGAIANHDKTPYLTISNCGFDGNVCGSGRVGSAIVTHGGSLFINNSWFINHTTSSYEGIAGIYKSGGTIKLTDVTQVKPATQQR